MTYTSLTFDKRIHTDSITQMFCQQRAFSKLNGWLTNISISTSKQFPTLERQRGCQEGSKLRARDRQKDR